jgi:hypothetical protein
MSAGDNAEAIAAAYYREQEAKVDALVAALVKEADAQGMDVDDVLAKIMDAYP